MYDRPRSQSAGAEDQEIYVAFTQVKRGRFCKIMKVICFRQRCSESSAEAQD